MAQTLETQLINYDEKTATVSIKNPIETVDIQAFSAGMDLILSTNMYLTPGGSIVVIRCSRIVERNTESVEM
ncbi:DUF2922 domain-containing protein [Fredinandcohnia sp. FSL W7-1320]|uniref:DUF2922 domain-containing protein n=1 Tax=Fredinandcohnia sp. FSL W7-1320 TaxID=2954540 RepID=UPI0030FD3514